MSNGLKIKKHNPLAIISLIVVGLLLLSFILIASLPSILSTNWGKRVIFSHLKSKYHVDVNCQRLSLQWFGHLEVTDLDVVHPKTKTHFTCDSIKTEASLIDIVLKKDFKHLFFNRPHLKVSPSLVSFLCGKYDRKIPEGVAKLASRVKFDDFFVGSIFGKVTYPFGHRHFAKNRIQRKKRGFDSECSFAIPSPLKQFLAAGFTAGLYGNDVKNWEFDKEVSQNVEITPIQSGTDSSSRFGMPNFRLSFPYKGIAECSNGKIELTPEKLDPILFDEMTVYLENNPDQSVLNGCFVCKTDQKGVHGTIQADVSLTQIQSSTPSYQAKVMISELPVAGIDQLISLFKPQYRGLLLHTLGETADVILDSVSSSGNFDMDFSATSPQFQAQLAITTRDNKAYLKEPATFTLKMTPELFQKLTTIVPKLSSFALCQEGVIQANLSQFISPIAKSMEDLQQALFDALVTTQEPLVFDFKGMLLRLNHFEIHAKRSTVSELIDFNTKTSLEMGNESATCALQGVYEPSSQKGNYSFTASKIPVPVLGEWIGMDALPTLLGPNISLQASGNLGREKTIHVTIKSPLLTLQDAQFVMNDSCILQKPISFNYILQPTAFPSLQIAQATSLQGRINALTIPLSTLESMQLDMQLSTDYLEMMRKSAVAIKNIQTKLLIRTLDQISLSLTSDRIEAHFSAKYQLPLSKMTLNQPFSFNIIVDNTLMHALIDTPARLTDTATLAFTVDLLSFSPKTFSMDNVAFQGKGSLPKLNFIPYQGYQEISLQEIILPFQWNGPQKNGSLSLSSNIQEKNALPANNLSLGFHSAESIEIFDGISMKINGHDREQITEAEQMKSAVSMNNGSISFNASFTNMQWNALNLATINSTLDVQKLPTSLIDSLLGQPLSNPLFGIYCNINLKMKSTPVQQNLSFNLFSDLINVKNCEVVIKDNELTLTSTQAIQWTISSSGYRILDQLLTKQQKAAAFELKEPTLFQINLSQLSLPLQDKPIQFLSDRLPSICFDLTLLQCVGKISNSSMTFFDTTSHELTQLSAAELSFNKSQKNTPITFSCNAKISSQDTVKNNSFGKIGSIALKGSIENLFDETGSMHVNKLTTQISLQADNFPSRLLDLGARLKGRTDYPFTKIFGSSINASCQANISQLSGPLSLNLNSPQVRLSLTGKVQNGGLLLDQPVYAQMKITPEVSRLFLKEVNLLSLSYFYSQAPVSIEIPSQGFYLPIQSVSLDKIAIPSARIELGKIACRNEGNINAALGLLKAKQFDKNKELLLWFAPLDFHVNQGIFDIERTEILLADSYDIAIWGQLLLLEDYVDMSLGITAPTLSKAFGIKNLPPDYVLTIPMKGKMDNVQINTSKATSKIALLLATQQKALTESFGKNPAGAVFGGLLQQMARLPDNDNVPPAKHPFPWERGKTGSLEDVKKSSEKKRRFRHDDKPLKQILKVLR